MEREIAGCLDDDALAALGENLCSREELARISRHLDGCAACRLLVSSMMRAISPEASSNGGPGAAAALLAPGARFSRYEILARLGSGGMGVVYLARDPDLDRKLAIKVLRPDLGLPSDAARQAVLREAQAMARLSGPRVVAIHDVGSVGEHVFIAMEYVEGATLRAWLGAERRGWREIVDVFVAAGRGLADAHAAGLVHRDFKPDNVIVGTQGRVCVTDLGLARLMDDLPAEVAGAAAAAPSALATTLMRTGKLLGTPRYMAPEQIDGKTLDGRADAFSFAVALYEALYGQRPFAGDRVADVRAAMARAELRRPPRGVAPEAIARVLERALAEDPDDRHPSMTALVDALERVARPARKRRAVVTAAIFAAALATAWGVHHQRPAATKPAPAATAHATPLRRGVAVLGLRDLSAGSDTRWLSIALSRMLATELGAGEQLRVSAGEDVTAARRDLALPDADRFSPATLQRLRRRLDVDVIVIGSYVVSGEALRIDLALQDTSTGQTIAMLALSGEMPHLLDVAARAGVALRGSLGVAAAPASVAASRAALPHDAAAARLYAEAAACAAGSDYAGARDRLEQALSREPRFVAAQSALSEAYLQLGDHKRARLHALLAFDGAAELPRAERLVLEARLRGLDDQWDRAAELERALFTFFPDDLRYGLLLARAQTEGVHFADAHRTIDALHRLPPPLGDDARIDLLEAFTWGKQGDSQKRLQAAERAIDKARASGAQLLVAEGELDAGESSFYRGDFGRAQELYRDAQRIFTAAGERQRAVAVVAAQAQLDEARGDFDAALRGWRSAADFYRQMGNDERYASKLERIAQAYYDKLDFAHANALFDETLAIYRRLDNQEGIGNVLSDSAFVLLDEGDVVAAEQRLREALRILHALDSRHNESNTEDALAATLRLEGRLDEAERLVDDAIARFRALGDRPYLAQALPDRAAILRDRDRLDDARRVLVEDQTVAAAEQTDAARIALKLAENQLDRGDLVGAEHAVRDLLAKATAQDGGSLRTLLARILLARRDPAAAATASAAFDGDANAPLIERRLGARLVAAVAHARAGQCASPELDELFRVAHTKHLVAWELEIELARADADASCGRRDRARARLRGLAARAEALGFVRVTRLARTALE